MSESHSSRATAAPPAILVIRFSSLGDVLLTAPVLRALRAHFPSAHLDFLTAEEFADAARLLPGVDGVLPFQRRSGWRGLLRLRADLSRRYTILIDLQNSPRSAFLRSLTFPMVWVKAKRYRVRRWFLVRCKWDFYGATTPVAVRYLEAAASLGVQDDGRGLDLMVPDNARKWAADFAERYAPDRPLIVFCPGARHETKKWPADRWMELGRSAAAAGMSVGVVGSRNEESLVTEIAKAIPGAFAVYDRGIGEIAAMMERAAAVVSNDSGLMHLAAGVNARLVAIFGPTVEPFGFYPFRARAEVLDHELPCRPCRALGGAACPKRHFRCMMDTHPADAWAAVNRVINQTAVIAS
ncbi:MAG: glycosyltransferase family 9 protein [bacterium]|nr:glycosyltransferase family 9 protein [bacterium]